MTIDDQPPGVLLQPRGRLATARRHYERSVRRGISLAEYAGSLKAHLETLAELYPDGDARLWGATPTESTGNEKFQALRDRRVGDTVLFYADKAFYASASIAHLFRDPAAARAIWGAELSEGREVTWEHMMALADVQPLDPPVPAEELGVPVPLRGMRLAESSQAATIHALLDGRTHSAKPSSTWLKQESLTRREFVTQLTTLGASRWSDALTVLWMIGKRADCGLRRAIWPEFRDALGPLLVKVGSSEPPEQPVLSLRSTTFWEVDGFDPQRNAFGEDAAAGFTVAANKLLNSTNAQGEVIAVTMRQLPDETDRVELLETVGLAGFASASGQPVERVEGRGLRMRRDAELAKRVKSVHEDTCQVCDVQLETRDGFRSEAAHIRGLGAPHDGPDEIENLLCLCPNHHAQFDGFAIYVDEEWNVRRTRNRELIAPLRREAGHTIDDVHVAYHRALCGREI
ncbi:HNH endonuclease [Amycolatopsis lurida]|uniref:HNH endonuclease n=1 Tax=Amycolatopsis lurida TaxID=31959 RepID=UPI0018E91CB1|nr:HNH endonuclease [Amycolatopsis lurida]